MVKRKYKCSNKECDAPAFDNFSENVEDVTCVKCFSKCVEIKKVVPKKPFKTPRDLAHDKATKLPPDWRDLVIQLASEGCSDVEIEAHFMKFSGLKAANVDAMCRALKENDEEFKTTLKKAHILCEAWWVGQVREHKYHPKDMTFETAAWFIMMKNKFGWRDKTELEHTVPDNLMEKYAAFGIEQLKGKIAELIGIPKI